MKLFNSIQIHDWDRNTIENEPISSIALMERAAACITQAITEEWTAQTRVVVFAGPGNNGGDALAVARMLAELQYQVDTYLFNINNHLSPECKQNRDRLRQTRQVKGFTEVTQEFDPPVLDADTLVIDGLFGVGLNKPLAGGFASLVKYINSSEAKVLSIDIPSGLMTEDNTYNVKTNIIHASHTYTLGSKKLSMMLADNQPYLGKVKVLDIGLDEEYLDKTKVQYDIIEFEDACRLLQPRGQFVHKGDMGHALIIAGSYAMAGASVLATKACLRSGVGKVTAHIPQCNYTVMQMSVPEAIVHIDNDEEIFSQSVETTAYDAIGIGPGLAKNETTAIALIAQVRSNKTPIVLDADALNILSSHRAWIQQLPEGLILTPHPKELDRLVGYASNDDYERLMRASELAVSIRGYVLLKGHYSALCMPDGHVTFNSTGNAGMATAGSGDVLTGVITALLARGYERVNAALLGMYLHGLAGDLAAEDLGMESLMASDIIDYLPQAFKTMAVTE